MIMPLIIPSGNTPITKQNAILSFFRSKSALSESGSIELDDLDISILGLDEAFLNKDKFLQKMGIVSTQEGKYWLDITQFKVQRDAHNKSTKKIVIIGGVFIGILLLISILLPLIAIIGSIGIASLI